MELVTLSKRVRPLSPRVLLMLQSGHQHHHLAIDAPDRHLAKAQCYGVTYR